MSFHAHELERTCLKTQCILASVVARFSLKLAFVAMTAWTALSAEVPGRITIVSDDNYPPYLFRDADGKLVGLIMDKWTLWSARNGVEIEIHGMRWADAQEQLLAGKWDVIDPLSYTERRAPLYEFSPGSAIVESRIYFHHTITGINDTSSMRGFTIGVKKGSACADWLTAQGVLTQRAYPTMLDLIHGAAADEVRLFCADEQPTQYFLSRENLTGDFRQSKSLYKTELHWAVRKGRVSLREFVDRGFDKISREEMKALEEKWVGTPLPRVLDSAFLRYGGIALGAGVLLGGVLIAWNAALRRRVAVGTKELRDTLGQLQRKNAELERFTYTVSHDLKGPLVTIKTFSGSLLQSIGENDFTNLEKDLKRIDGAANTMRALLDGLLELSRAGVLHNALPIQLNQAVAEVLESLAGLRVGRTIRMDVDPELGLVFMDERRLAEVIQNLLENAIKHTKHRADAHIQITAETRGAHVILCVRDNGIGVEPQYQDVIFGLFNKLDPATDGSGIGLAIVRRIVEVYGGRVWVESKGGGTGAAFFCELPRTR